jgi:acetate kinase
LIVQDVVAVLNAGSSSLKFSLYRRAAEGLALVTRGQAEGLFTSPKFVAKDADGKSIAEKNWSAGTQLGHAGALDHLIGFLRERFADHRLVAVGHRVVHGGPSFAKPVRLDATVVTALEKYVPLAPLHQPHNLAPIRAILERTPDLPQVACFDTAFHRGQPAGRPGVRATQIDYRTRRPPLRVPRHFLRIHRERAGRLRSEGGRRQDDRPASR